MPSFITVQTPEWKRFSGIPTRALSQKIEHCSLPNAIEVMNRPSLLHVVERLESLVGKLPTAIQKPILSELTPLKELFLQQRPPRLLFSGSDKASLKEIIHALLPGIGPEMAHNSIETNRWQDLHLVDRGTISILDAREANKSADALVQSELRRQPADIILFLDEDDGARRTRKSYIDNLVSCLNWNDKTRPDTKLIGLVIAEAKPSNAGNHQLDDAEAIGRVARLQSALESQSVMPDRLLWIFSLHSSSKLGHRPMTVLSMLARELPNEARIELARVSRDREAQAEIAQVLVKSTTAICTAIGAQPIPLADLPILTTLQLVMVSGIMYLSGRERSLRAATEFVGALGANVGAGMLLREGARVILKFFPGWGNVVCGMVAGAGTYAIGRAAIAFFLEGLSLKESRRMYLASRKKAPRPALLGHKREKKEGARGK